VKGKEFMKTAMGRSSRRRRRGSSPLHLALLAFMYAGAAHAITPNEWRFRQTIEVPASGLIRVSLPNDTLDAARPNLEDIRLLDPAGHEVPYIIDRSLDEPESEIRPRDFQAQIESSMTRLRIETGTDATLRGVSLEAPGTGEFIKPVRIEGSHDGINWQLLVDHEPIFRLAGGATKLQVPLPRSSWPFLRVTIDDSRSAPVAFTGAQLRTGAVSSPTESMPVSMKSRDENPGVTRLVLTLGATNLTPVALHIETTEPLFARPVTVALARINGDEVTEQPLVSAVVYRMDVNGKTEARLDIPVDRQVDARELILFIQNGDSPPLGIAAVRGERRVVYLTFPAHEPGRYVMLTGNNQSAAPNYDLAALARDLKAARTTPLTASPVVANPDYQAADALAAVSFAGVKLDVGPWGYRKSLHVTKSGTQEVELDPDVLVHAGRDLADLRLMRDDRQIPFLLEKTSISRSVPLAQTSSNDPAKPNLSRWSLKLPRPGMPITRIVCTVGPGVFQRELRLSEATTDERGADYLINLGSIRVVQTDQKAHEIGFQLDRPPATEMLSVETDNGDNPAIDLHNFRADYFVTRVIFKSPADSAAPFWLYYGNRDAASPHYDVTLVATELLHAERQTASAGAEEAVKPSTAAGDVLTGSSRYIFWGVLGLVVVGLLGLVARFVPKAA
jgi:hypothetical protein